MDGLFDAYFVGDVDGLFDGSCVGLYVGDAVSVVGADVVGAGVFGAGVVGDVGECVIGTHSIDILRNIT